MFSRKYCELSGLTVNLATGANIVTLDLPFASGWDGSALFYYIYQVQQDYGSGYCGHN